MSRADETRDLAGHKAPLVVAHRGARWLAVENTLEALRIAFEEGAAGVEFDVQLTRDGELVLFHDDDLFSLTGIHGRVRDHTWRELRAMPLADRHGRRGVIPHLAEALALLGRVPEPKRKLINLELKVVGDNGPALTEAVVAALLAADAPAWLLSSFAGAALTRLKRCTVPFDRALLIDNDPSCDWWASSRADAAGAAALQRAAQEVGGHLLAVHPHGRLITSDRMALWREAGVRVHVWTLNQTAHWATAVAVGVDAVITDDPGAMARWLVAEGLA